MPIGNIQALAAAAPIYHDDAKVDWTAFEEGLHQTRFRPASALAASWCRLGHMNIEALVDAPTLAVIFPDGVFASTGRRKLLGGAVKHDGIWFGDCRDISPADHSDDRGFGKFAIEFLGAGDVLLGRLHWTWKARRFRGARDEIRMVAEERDRILSIVGSQLAAEDGRAQEAETRTLADALNAFGRYQLTRDGDPMEFYETLQRPFLERSLHDPDGLAHELAGVAFGAGPLALHGAQRLFADLVGGNHPNMEFRAMQDAALESLHRENFSSAHLTGYEMERWAATHPHEPW